MLQAIPRLTTTCADPTILAQVPRGQRGALKKEEEALTSYGANLGIAFQLVDDALDYSARQAQLGKTVGDDFSEGKITLPVILAFRRGSEEDRKFWNRTLGELKQVDGDLEQAQQLILKYGALDDTISRAQHYAAIAAAEGAR